MNAIKENVVWHLLTRYLSIIIALGSLAFYGNQLGEDQTIAHEGYNDVGLGIAIMMILSLTVWIVLLLIDTIYRHLKKHIICRNINLIFIGICGAFLLYAWTYLL